MFITLDALIKKSPHFDERVWGASVHDSKTAFEYDLSNHAANMRASHNEYVARFSNMINEVSNFIIFSNLYKKKKSKERFSSSPLQEIYSNYFLI
jgi:DNA-binding FadR family transcriptional regulator